MGHKLKFVLSDLHLGAGRTKEGVNLLEDFRAGQALVDFLHEIGHESERGRREIELIINGDFFEFLQVPAVDEYDPQVTYPKEAYLDSSQEASIKRLNIIVEGHPEIFDALSDFMHVETARRSITIITGNHDVNLFWPGVKSRLREILGASGARASLLRFANEFVSREKIYVEHGHQHAEKMNGYYDSFDPRRPDDPSQLFYPVGSRFVIDFFNQAEAEWWFIDHVKPVPTLIWYAFHWNFELASRALVSLVQQSQALLATEASAPNHPPLLKNNALLEDLTDKAKRQQISEQYANDRSFRVQFHRQIQSCLSEVNLLDPHLPHIVDDPLEMGRAHQEQQHTLLRNAAKTIAEREKAKIILFGHSHYPIQEKLSNGSTYINTGSWVEDFSDASHQTWEALFNGSRVPGHPPTRLPYARIDYGKDDMPTAKLLYFDNESAINPPPIDPVPASVAQAKSFFERNFEWLSRLLRFNNR